MEASYSTYARGITEGKIKACKKTIKACQLFLEEIDKCKDETYKYYFDSEEVEQRIQFIETLKLYEGKWSNQRIKLLDWQKFIIASIYGFKNRITDKRKIQRAFIHVPRKVGKTTLISALMILALLDEDGAQVYSIATKRDQAKIAFKNARQFILTNETLSNIEGLLVREHHIQYEQSILRALSSDAGTQDGLNASFVLADEVAAYKNNDLINVMESSMVARENPLLIMITTSNYVSNSVGYLEYEKLEDYLKGIYKDETFFGISYELDLEDDWRDITNYEKAIPSLGYTIPFETIETKLNQAINDDVYQREFKVKHLNYWIQGNRDAWIDDRYWKLIRENEEPKEEEYIDLPCFGGLDLSKRNDLTCYTLCLNRPGFAGEPIS